MVPPDLNKLARLRVKQSTLKEYDRALQVFIDWLPEDFDFESAEEMDEKLNAFAHHTYEEQDGNGLGLVDKVKSGLEFYFPELMHNLPRSTISLQGWRKVHETKSHGVCPQEAAFLIADDLRRHGQMDAATAVLLLFDTYMRISDLKILKVSSVMILDLEQEDLPHYAVCHVSVSKTNRNETIMVRPKYLAILLERWKMRRSWTVGGQGKLLGIHENTLRNKIAEAATRLGLASLSITPHTLRYGGATTDKIQGKMTDSEIQTRGRWENARTMRQYVQIARLMEQTALIPEPALRQGKEMIKNPYRAFGVDQDSG